MKVTFQLEDATSQLILTPENARDKSCLALCIHGKNNIKIKPTVTDTIILEFCLTTTIEETQEEEKNDA